MMSGHTALSSCIVLVASVVLGAQTSPPPNGLNGNIALEGTTKKVDSALHVVIVETVDGVEHVLHYTKDLLVHGGKGGSTDPLKGLEAGSTVVVHYAKAGTGETVQEIDRLGDKTIVKTEGVVERVDRARKQVTIKFANGRTETLQLTDRAAAEAGGDLADASLNGAKVVVYYSDDAGRKVAHYFKRIDDR